MSPTYSVSIKKDAVKAIAGFDRMYQRRIAEVLRTLASDPRPRGCAPLKGIPDTWRVRVGDIRIVNEINDSVLLVHVVRIAHRRDVYRKL